MQNKKPTTALEMEILISGLLEYYQHIDSPFNTDKCLGYSVDELGHVLIIKFGFITESIIQPDYTSPDEIIEPKSGEIVITWTKSQSLLAIVTDIHDAFERIQSYKIITDASEANERDWEDNE